MQPKPYYPIYMHIFIFRKWMYVCGILLSAALEIEIEN